MTKFGVTLGPTLAEPPPARGDGARLAREAPLGRGAAPLARGASVGGVIAGKYRIERVIGHGGMGVVVAATHLPLQRTVAIKLIRGDWADDPLAVERLVREARALASIQSQHVARVLDVGTLDDGIPFIVMEYLEGHDLDTLLRRDGPLPVADAIDYLLQACEALAEAHRNGIVHRDIKPANLFVALQPGGVACIKVVDFGISKLINSGSVESLTHPSRIVGSLYHMAPEQMSGDPVDARTDVWALGVLLFELLTGRKPFQGGAWPAVCARVLSEAEPPQESLGEHVPAEVQSAVRRCLQRMPEDRFPNVAELAVALSPFGTRTARVSLEHIVRLATSTGSLAADSSPVPPALGANPRGGFDREGGAATSELSPQRDSAFQVAPGPYGEPLAARDTAPSERLAEAPPGGSLSRLERRVVKGLTLGAARVRRGRVQWLVVGAAALVVIGVPWLVTRLVRAPAPGVQAAAVSSQAVSSPAVSSPVVLPPSAAGVAPLMPPRRAAQGAPAVVEATPALLPGAVALPSSAPGAPSLPSSAPGAASSPAPPGAARGAPVPPSTGPASGRILEPPGAERVPSPPTSGASAAPSTVPRVRVLTAPELAQLVTPEAPGSAPGAPAAATAPAKAEGPATKLETEPPVAAASGAGAAAGQAAPPRAAQAGPRGADPWDFRDLEFE